MEFKSISAKIQHAIVMAWPPAPRNNRVAAMPGSRVMFIPLLVLVKVFQCFVVINATNTQHSKAIKALLMKCNA